MLFKVHINNIPSELLDYCFLSVYYIYTCRQVASICNALTLRRVNIVSTATGNCLRFYTCWYINRYYSGGGLVRAVSGRGGDGGGAVGDGGDKSRFANGGDALVATAPSHVLVAGVLWKYGSRQLDGRACCRQRGFRLVQTDTDCRYGGRGRRSFLYQEIAPGGEVLICTGTSLGNDKFNSIQVGQFGIITESHF